MQEKLEKRSLFSFSTNQSEEICGMNLGNKLLKSSVEFVIIIVFFFSLSNEKLSEYPAWLIVYITQVVFPMIGLAAIALKIELRYGRVLRRELLGN